MPSIHVDPAETEWVSGVPFYGPAATYQGRHIVQLKILSDRRADGGGIAWLVRFTPPPGKLIKIIATALSEEHSLILEGGRATKSGEPRKQAGGYSLNTTGQPHSAFIAHESVALVIYSGEPDEIHAMEVVDLDQNTTAG